MINFIDKKGDGVTFFHVPKTGGMTVLEGIFGHQPAVGNWRKYNSYAYNDKCGKFSDHFTYMEAKRRGFQIHNRSVAFVRNPWRRCVSAYLYGLREDLFLWRIPANMSFKQWVNQRWMADEYYEWRPCGWHQQYEYLVNDSQEIMVTDVHRLEDVDVFDVFEDLLGCKVPRVKRNVTSEAALRDKGYKDYRDFYDTALIDKVAEIYHKDIELFDYTFE